MVQATILWHENLGPEDRQEFVAQEEKFERDSTFRDKQMTNLVEAFEAVDFQKTRQINNI